MCVHVVTFQIFLKVETIKNEAARGFAIVIVMKHFERFTARRKQTLLYNLFDLTQNPSVRVAIIGLSTFANATDELEKRIQVCCLSACPATYIAVVGGPSVTLLECPHNSLHVFRCRWNVPTLCVRAVEVQPPRDSFHEATIRDLDQQ